MECLRRFMAVVDVGGKKFAVQISSLFVNPPTIAPTQALKNLIATVYTGSLKACFIDYSMIDSLFAIISILS